ncbi:MAG: class I SAM-dependent methyltransferase [Alphaproteobacteria bacterium]|nr:class I SAM-dependent methyltransferase [Alphaproteobacteria bacterium]
MNKYAGSALAALLLLAAAPVLAAPSAAIMAAVADPSRPDNDKAVDALRKPAETVDFAGVKPGDKVAELAPGAGYYTRILAKVVGDSGKVYTYAGRPTVPANPPVAPNVVPVAGTNADFAVPEPVDVVWTSRNYHDFQNAMPDMSGYNKKVFAALKPGGTYFILDHAAGADAADDVHSALHRSKEAVVRREVEAAGFRFVASSDILRNPADDKTKRVQEQDVRGKTDQYLLKFVKPR